MSTLTRLLGYFRPYLGRMLLAALLLAVSGALMGAVVSAVKPLVNEVLLRGAPGPAPSGTGVGVLDGIRARLPTEKLAGWAREHAFVEVPLLFVAIYFLRALFGYFGEYLTLKVGACTIRDLRLDLYRAITFQSLRFFQTHATGAILSRLIHDVQQVQRVATAQLANGVRVGTMVPFLVAVAFVHEWRFSLVAMLGLPLLGYPVVQLSRRLRRAFTATQQGMADVSQAVTEAVGGAKVVQSFGMERYEVERFNRALGAMLRAELRAGRTTSLLPALIELTGASLGATLFYVAGLEIARGRLDPGDFTVVLFCLGLLFVSIRRLNSVYAELQRALAAAERVFDMLDREREIRDRPGGPPLPPFSREIRFERVDFGYGDELVLEGIELTLRRGEVVALVGVSGSGKSTLVSLLPRFYDPTRGRITIDGHDLRAIALTSLRAQIGLVTQETVVFDDSARNNIAYGRAECALAQVVEAARAAHAHEFIERLPQGYDTMLGERGMRLSMGQRQRITIARALLKDPPILILDEATSALDAESEAMVQQALETLMRGRTSLVIAHRLATVRRADRIVVLDGGRIVEQGSHSELLARGGVYARLHELQFQEDATRDVGSSP